MKDTCVHLHCLPAEHTPPLVEMSLSEQVLGATDLGEVFMRFSPNDEAGNAKYEEFGFQDV